MTNLISTPSDANFGLGAEAQAFSAELADRVLMQAAATNVGGFTLRQDFLPMTIDYRRKNTVLWQLLEKMAAHAPKIQEIRRNVFPNVGFTNRADLSTTPVNDISSIPADLSDPGQDVKAIAGLLNVTHFGRSMEAAQGYAYGNTTDQDTDDLISATYRLLERYLFVGDATISGNLQFNGITNLASTDAENSSTLDVTGGTPPSIVQKIGELSTKIANHPLWTHRVTHIFTSGAGYELIRKETERRNTFFNQTEVVPGLQVPSIQGVTGNIPIVVTPYIYDVLGTSPDPDQITYYLVDDSTLSWRGLAPYGGANTFEPQIFDVSNIVNGVPLLEKRLVILYGTPYAKNRGKGIHKLVVSAPRGSGYYAAP
jgi:hypothetical protein